MELFPLTLYEYLIKKILDTYSEETGMPIAFMNKAHHIGTVWQSNRDFCSPLCKYLQELNPDICHEDFKNRVNNSLNRITICHAGLWDIIIPVIDTEDNYNLLGYLITGQRKIKTDFETSEKKLKELLNIINCKTDEEKEQIKNYFNKTYDIEIVNFHSEGKINDIKAKIIEVVRINNNERKKITNLSHDIILPIQSLIAAAWFIKGQNSDYQIIKRSDHIIRTSKKLTKIAENVSYSYLSVNHKPTNPEELFLREIIEEIREIFRYDAEDKNIIIYNNISKHAKIFGTRTDINRCFFNLIHNAVKYSYPSINIKGEITINSELFPNNYKITICNKGYGFLDEEKNLILREGQRGILVKDKVRTGSGIGLTVAKNIIENHQGKFRIDTISETSNRIYGPYFTTVTIELLRFLKGTPDIKIKIGEEFANHIGGGS